jgi:nicotinamide-nucleotide amidase
MSEMSREHIDKLVAELAERLLAEEILLATAESCTGGGISEALTARAGSSRWFDCGFVSYSNSAKSRLLNVPESLFDLPGPGAVSEETALAMARGALANSRAELAVAVTGIAGPDGGSKEKPVGTVWIAWQWQQQALAHCFHFRGDRATVRLATIVAALEGLLSLLGGNS